jgi:hypothetical protein
MLPKVTRRLGITRVKVTTDLATVPLSLAVFGTALKNMDTALIDIFNGRGGFKEGIYW